MRKLNQVKDVIEYSHEIHARLAKFYDDLNNQHQKARIKMLLDYLGRHERNLANCLAEYEQETAQELMDTWLEFTPTTNIDEKIKNLPLHADMTLQQLVDYALDLDNIVVELYRDALLHVELPELTELFQNLIEMENQEKKNMVRNAMMLDDI